MQKSNIYNHAKVELEAISAQCANPHERPVIEEFQTEILALVDKFGLSGQSGGSAPFVAGVILSTLKSLLAFKPLTPITGAPDEWVEVADGILQNKRLSALFSENGRAYYLDAIVWKDENNGFSGTVEGIKSRQFVEFPFTPKHFYIDVVLNGEEYEIKDKKQLDAVFKHYNK